ncbi:unnamed protein product [Rotaria sp. Silwood2]|nr:unnamed protein product [Rotaria sp. Silwood2]
MRLVYHITSVISTETRAFNNENRAGLNFFTPNVNIFRDPRWGRGQETPGKDPFLTSEYVYALVQGLQRGEDEHYLKIIADCKAYNAYDLENWIGTDSFHFDAKISDQDLVETCIHDAHVAKDTVVVALHTDTDLNCSDFYLKHRKESLDDKTIVEKDIDRALERTFNVLTRLGWFDPPEQQFYRQLTKADDDTPQSRKLSLESAQDSIILLKNVNRSMPLHIDPLINKKIALIEPTANATESMQESYFGKTPFLIDPGAAIKAMTAGKLIDVEFMNGCKIKDPDESGFSVTIELVRSADIVILFGGLDQSIEGESVDHTSITVPDIQLSLIRQLEKVVRSPIHVVIISDSGLDLTYIRDSPQFGSLIWMGYGGQSDGLAISNVVFDQYNPGGRLPITMYSASYVDDHRVLVRLFRVNVTNTGDISGDDVVLASARSRNATMNEEISPIK